MTDLSLSLATAGATTDRRWRRTVPVLLAFAAAGVALGLLDRPAVLPEPGLALLLRFMAVLKGGAALGAAALLLWRRRGSGTLPVAPGLAVAYDAGLALMALAPGLIWSLGPVAAGALCFHAGLVLFAVAALRDDAGLSRALPAGLRRRG